MVGASYCIARNFRMVQIFAYFEHMQIVRKLKPTKFLLQILRLPNYFSHGNFFLYGAPDVPVNKVAYGLVSLMVNETYNIYPNMCPRGCGLNDQKIRNFELRNFILMENSKLYENVHQRKFSAIWYQLGYTTKTKWETFVL